MSTNPSKRGPPPKPPEFLCQHDPQPQTRSSTSLAHRDQRRNLAEESACRMAPQRRRRPGLRRPERHRRGQASCASGCRRSGTSGSTRAAASARAAAVEHGGKCAPTAQNPPTPTHPSRNPPKSARPHHHPVTNNHLTPHQRPPKTSHPTPDSPRSRRRTRALTKQTRTAMGRLACTELPEPSPVT